MGTRAGSVVGVVAIRVGTMPGFTELALDAPLAQLLGTENFGALLRLCHLAQPSGDVPGSWVFAHNQIELAAYLGCSKNKVASILKMLCESGALARDRGIRLGRSMGATTDRYFITAIPGLTSPTPPVRPPRDRSPQPIPNVSSPTISKLNNSTLKTSSVNSAPRLSPVASQSAQDSGQNQSHLINVSNKDLLGDEEKQPNPSQLLKTALARIGWDRDLPQHSDPLLVAKVATWLAHHSDMANRAGYLNTILRNGDLETFAQSKGLTGNTRVGRMGSEPAGFTSAEYVQLRAQFPQWDGDVQRAAGELAASRGVPVRMALLCEVAATIELPARDGFSHATAREAGA